MLNDIYIHQQLAKSAGRHSRYAMHTVALAELRRRNSPPRRVARQLGQWMHSLAEQLLAYAADRPARLSTPLPPIVELRPNPTTFSQN